MKHAKTFELSQITTFNRRVLCSINSHRTENEVRLEVGACRFWQAGQMIFFDVKVFNPNARRYTKKGLSKTYQLTEKEKKRYYNEQIMQVEHGTREMY